MGEPRFIPNPDYPPDWEERQKEKYGDCFGCKSHSEPCGWFGGRCLKSGCVLKYPIRGCCKRDPKWGK